MDEHVFRKRVFFVLFATAFTGLGVLFVLSAFNVILLIFIAIMFAIFLTGTSTFISDRTRLSPRLALLIVVLGLFVGIGLLTVFLGPGLAEQMDQLIERIPQALENLESTLRQTTWGEQILNSLTVTGNLDNILFTGDLNVVQRVTGIFSATVGIIATLIVILFVGLYLAIEPEFYIKNFVRLFPLDRRERIRTVLNSIGQALQLWLLARFFSMIIVGVLTLVGLMLLGVPVALSLAVIAGLLSFVPNIGPILGTVPAALVALTQSPTQVIYVVLLYIFIQIVESYFITPVIERKTVHLPPALTMGVQIMLAIVVGRLGLLLAAPLLVVGILLVRMLYVEDVLHDPEAIDQDESNGAI